MRIWLVPLEELDDRRILGQHQEMHMLVSMIDNPRFETHPLVMFYRQYRGWLFDYHTRLVKEMSLRFVNSTHKTDMPMSYVLTSESIVFPQSWIDYDRQDLASRLRIRRQKWSKRSLPIWLPKDMGCIEASCQNCLKKPSCSGPSQGKTFCEGWRDESHPEVGYQLNVPIPLYQYMKPQVYGVYSYDGIPEIGESFTYDRR